MQYRRADSTYIQAHAVIAPHRGCLVARDEAGSCKQGTLESNYLRGSKLPQTMRFVYLSVHRAAPLPLPRLLAPGRALQHEYHDRVSGQPGGDHTDNYIITHQYWQGWSVRFLFKIVPFSRYATPWGCRCCESGGPDTRPSNLLLSSWRTIHCPVPEPHRPMITS